MKIQQLVVVGLGVGGLFLLSNKKKSSSNSPTIPIKFTCDSVNLLASNDKIRSYLTKFKDEYFTQNPSYELQEVDFIKFTGFMINKLDVKCYDKYLKQEITPDQGILIYTVLSYFTIYTSIYEKFSTGADAESAVELLQVFKDKKKLVRDYLDLGNEEDTDFKIIFKNIILSLEKNRAYDIL